MNYHKKCDYCQGYHAQIQQFYGCKHSFCQGCIKKLQCFGQCRVCIEKQNQAQNQKTHLSNFISDVEAQKQITQSIIQSKKYSSPNEKSNFPPYLNYCAVCLLYLSDHQINEQRKLNIPLMLNCKYHTLCLGCYTHNSIRPSLKTYFCEICERIQQ